MIQNNTLLWPIRFKSIDNQFFVLYFII